MTRHYLPHTVFLGCMLIVFSGFASADIVQCIDETQAVTYTDVPCKNGADTVRAFAVTNHSAASAKVSPPTPAFAAAEAARAAASVKNGAHNRSFSLDVQTLQAARSVMLLTDQASSLSRQQKLAALDHQDQRWFNF